MSQTQISITIRLLDESAVEFQEPVQVPQVDDRFIWGSAAPSSLLLEDFLDGLAELKNLRDIQMRDQAIALDLPLEYASVIIMGEFFKIDLVESVQEGLGQSLSTSH